MCIYYSVECKSGQTALYGTIFGLHNGPSPMAENKTNTPILTLIYPRGVVMDSVCVYYLSAPFRGWYTKTEPTLAV